MRPLIHLVVPTASKVGWALTVDIHVLMETKCQWTAVNANVMPAMLVLDALKNVLDMVNVPKAPVFATSSMDGEDQCVKYQDAQG